MSEAQDIQTKPSHLWRPGESANPGGRPKWLKEAREQMREHVPAAVAKVVEVMSGKVGEKDVPLKMQLEAAREILDRVLGRPVQTVLTPDIPPDGDMVVTQIDLAREVAFLLSSAVHAQAVKGQERAVLPQENGVNNGQ